MYKTFFNTTKNNFLYKLMWEFTLKSGIRGFYFKENVFEYWTVLLFIIIRNIFPYFHVQVAFVTKCSDHSRSVKREILLQKYTAENVESTCQDGQTI